MRLLPCAAVAACWVCPVRAEVALPSIFSDHMVLQAEVPAVVFGTAAADEAVTIEIAGQKKMAAANKDGKWSIKLDPLKAGGPHELKVSGKNAIVVKDVLVGEVWLASGQSNMKYPLSRSTDAAKEIAAADHPQVRYLTVGGKWAVCSPKTAGGFAGPAYFFAVDLHQQRKVPVGIVENSVNGAVAQQFISPKALETDPELATLLKQHDQPIGDIWKSSFAPIVPYTIRGALWCQGEGNRDFPVTYRRLMTDLIADWRAAWGQGDFPFVIVQLSGYGERKPEMWEGKDCAIREAQLKVAQAVPKTALVVTIDLGLVKDVHYPDKKPVGQRMVRAAQALAYGEKVEASGPIFEKATFEDGKALVSFTHLGGGLTAKGDKLTGFLLCGADKKWHRAEAVIEGEKVVVTSAKLAKPMAVRYAWERNPECNLFNKEGLPASPFRSDDYMNYFTRDGDK